MNKPTREKQIHPELYGWDYSDKKKNHLPGVGFMILYPDHTTETIHFNKNWQDEYEEGFIPADCILKERCYDPEAVRGNLDSGFKFICELP